MNAIARNKCSEQSVKGKTRRSQAPGSIPESTGLDAQPLPTDGLHPLLHLLADRGQKMLSSSGQPAAKEHKLWSEDVHQ